MTTLPSPARLVEIRRAWNAGEPIGAAAPGELIAALDASEKQVAELKAEIETLDRARLQDAARIAELKSQLATAVEAERRECIEDVCGLCRDGVPLDRIYHTTLEGSECPITGCAGHDELCPAAPIRSRVARSRPTAASEGEG